MKRPYIWLVILLALAVVSQGTFTIDVVRELSGDYALRPFSVDDDTIGELSSAASQAGLRSGDRLVAVEDRPFRNARDLLEPVHEKKPGQTLAVTAERAGKVSEFQVELKPLRTWWLFAAVSLLFMPWLCILLGFWVAALRPRDFRAWLVLGILLGLSQLQRQGILDPRAWPTALAAVSMAFREVAVSGWAACMLLFGIYFPVRWRVD